MQIYLVGGAVRDALLGLPVTERDWVVVGGTPEVLLAQGYKPVGQFFPVFLHPQTKEEYALARTERKVGPGYHGFNFNADPQVTLEEDLLRRDLTINAIAQTPAGELIDPYGGQRDLQAKILRHVSPAFSEDPVRVLRIARFAARFAPLGFSVAPETKALMRDMALSNELAHLTPERVWNETARVLAGSEPVVFFRLLRETQGLKVLFPELEALYGVPQNPLHHPEIDTGDHVERVLIQASLLTDDPVVRFAALLHDLGKALTSADYLPNHPDHEKNGRALILGCCERLRVPREYQDLAVIVGRYHGELYAAKTAEAILSLFEKCDIFRRPQRLKQILLACEADFRGRPGYETKPFVHTERFEQAFAAANQIVVSQVIATLPEKTGEAIKKAVSEARLVAIREALMIS